MNNTVLVSIAILVIAIIGSMVAIYLDKRGERQSATVE